MNEIIHLDSLNIMAALMLAIAPRKLNQFDASYEAGSLDITF